MPAARKPVQSSRSARAFKEPAALKKLSKSLEAAQQALADLREHAGRGASAGVRDLHKDLRTSITGANRASGKLGKALARDFEQAEKKLGQAARTAGTRTRAAASRKRSPRAATKRTARKKS